MALLVLLALTLGQSAPRRPPEPLPVAVVAGDAADEEVLIRILTAVEEVKREVAERDDWFEVTDTRADARVVVRIGGYQVAEKMQPKVNKHILRGTPIMVEGSVVVETHSINAVVVISGETDLLIGTDQRENGASLQNAAADLAGELERHVKANYALLRGPE